MSSARIKKFVLTNSGNKLRKDDLIFVKRAADVEYRLARQTVIDYWKNGEIERENLCDAQPMLKRNAIHCGVLIGESCPICESGEIYYVTYVFGPRLPAHGRCISTKGELQRLNDRKSQLSAYVIEVCPDCGWNHLVRIASLGGK
ncbi:MAG: DUF5318 family protein [Acidimicrobiales bacterium]|jgi:hypothetical protein|nr:hypothetical protein [Actinomycetota bacterium]MCH1513966.1 DUF5318 domain-containing protein [Acidimicrobiales bacterium]HAQ03479.1 hypothetical protein [Acidimicrobiaceae bacterium]|tara:strand:- start:4855 stop:5289 length:435 start_codon:yes stop_codon:yes gene_type:complete